MIKNDAEEFSISGMKKQEILAILRKRNYRITSQRRILIDIILEGECTCCKEIYYQAVKKDAGIGIATVYRMVNTLEDIGVISRRNMYQINCEHWDKTNGMCRIILEDHTKIELSEQKWRQVVSIGLKHCGYVKNQNLKSIELVEKQ